MLRHIQISILSGLVGQAGPINALSPFVNLGMQHDGRRAEHWMKKVTTFCIVVGRREGFAREHQNGFL
jgi:hypothetical protein